MQPNFFFLDQVNRADAEAGAEVAVLRGGRAAALQVTEHRGAGFALGALGDLGRDLRADAAEADFALVAAVDHGHAAALGHCALGRDNERGGGATGHAFFNVGGEAFVGKGHLGDEDDIRAAGEAAVERNPAGVAAHDLEHHDALVAGGGGVEAVERVGDALHGGVEAERGGRGGKIIVDGLRHADDGDAVVEKLVGCGERTVAADADERAHAEVVERLLGLVDDRLRDQRLFAEALLGDEAAAVGRADDRAADRHDALSIFQGENLVVHGREEALIAVNKAEYFPAQGVGGSDGGADHGVEAGTVAAAG